MTSYKAFIEEVEEYKIPWPFIVEDNKLYKIEEEKVKKMKEEGKEKK